MPFKIFMSFKHVDTYFHYKSTPVYLNPARHLSTKASEEYVTQHLHSFDANLIFIIFSPSRSVTLAECLRYLPKARVNRLSFDCIEQARWWNAVRNKFVSLGVSKGKQIIFWHIKLLLNSISFCFQIRHDSEFMHV